MDNRTLLQVSSRREQTLSADVPYEPEKSGDLVSDSSWYENVSQEHQKHFWHESKKSKCSKKEIPMRAFTHKWCKSRTP